MKATKNWTLYSKSLTLNELRNVLQSLYKEHKVLRLRVKKLINLLKSYKVDIISLKQKCEEIGLPSSNWIIYEGATNLIAKRNTIVTELKVSEFKIRNIKRCKVELDRIYQEIENNKI